MQFFVFFFYIVCSVCVCAPIHLTIFFANVRECVVGIASKTGGIGYGGNQLLTKWWMKIEKEHIFHIMSDEFAIMKLIESEICQAKKKKIIQMIRISLIH